MRTQICSSCHEKLALTPANFHRHKNSPSGYTRTCKACIHIRVQKNENCIALPRIKQKAVTILFATGFSLEYIAKDFKTTEARVAYSLDLWRDTA